MGFAPLVSLLILVADVGASAGAVDIAPAAPAVDSTSVGALSSSPPAPPQAAAPSRQAPALMLVLDVTGGDLSADTRTGLTEALALLLVRRLNVEAYSTASLRERMNLASQQQLTGCDASSCFSELADALGARFVVYSRVVQLGGGRVLRVEIFDKDEGHTVALASVGGDDATALGKRLPEVVDDLVTSAAGALPVRSRALDVDVPTARPTSPLLRTGLVTAGVGLGVAAAGGLLTYLVDDRLGSIDVAASEYAADRTAAKARAIIEARDDLPQGPLLACGCGSGCATLGGIVATLVGSGMAVYGSLNPPTEAESP